MLAFIIIPLTAFIAALLTLFSGFGLGTLLMPVIAIFFPVTIAIAITAVVHLLNNIFKVLLLRKFICWHIVMRFGLPAMLTAFFGAWLLTYLAFLPSIFSYSIFTISANVEPVKIIVGVLLITLATIEGFKFIHITLKAKWLPIGGLISGFFGGLSGLQGALRSQFLLHANLNAQQFVGTNAAIATMVDVARLLIYGIRISAFTG